MIFPNKNIRLKNSLLGIGSAMLPLMGTPQSVSELWEKSRSMSEYAVSFEKFVLTLDFLFTVGLIEYKEGFLAKRHAH